MYKYKLKKILNQSFLKLLKIYLKHIFKNITLERNYT